MRRFWLNRSVDVSGVSGTGRVAQGCVFDNGKTVLTWLGNKASVTVFDCLQDCADIHLHGDAGRLEFLDKEPVRRSHRPRKHKTVEITPHETVQLYA